MQIDRQIRIEFNATLIDCPAVDRIDRHALCDGQLDVGLRTEKRISAFDTEAGPVQPCERDAVGPVITSRRQACGGRVPMVLTRVPAENGTEGAVAESIDQIRAAELSVDAQRTGDRCGGGRSLPHDGNNGSKDERPAEDRGIDVSGGGRDIDREIHVDSDIRNKAEAEFDFGACTSVCRDRRCPGNRAQAAGDRPTSGRILKIQVIPEPMFDGARIAIQAIPDAQHANRSTS